MYEQQYNPYSSNILIVKRYFKNIEVLILGILYFISAAIDLSVALTDNMRYKHYIGIVQTISDDFGFEFISYYIKRLNDFQTIDLILTILGSVVIPVIFAVAFILVFSMSRAASPRTNPMSGLTILFVLSIINLVFVIFAVVLIAVIYVLLFLSLMGFSHYIQSDELSQYGAVGMTIIGVLLLIGCTVAVKYALSRKNFYRSARRSMCSVELQSKGASSYGVFLIILAIVQTIGFIVNMIFNPKDIFFRLFPMYNNTWLTIISAALDILILILTAKTAIGYSKYISNKKLTVNTPSLDDTHLVDEAYASTPYRNPAAGYGDNFSDENSQPTVTCPACGASASANEAYCPNCGAKL